MRTQIESIEARSWTRPFLLVVMLAIGITTLSRIALLVWMQERVLGVGVENLPFILLQGLRFDILTVALFLGIPASFTPLALTSKRIGPIWMRGLCFYSLAVLATFLFMEFSTPSFINEFDARPDRRFVEYLIYPKEVFATVWGAHKVPLLFSIALLAVALRYGLKFLMPRFLAVRPVGKWAPLYLMPLTGFLTLAAIRSTTDHRPVNPSTVVFSRDPLANQFPLNSSYTALYALYELKGEEKHFAYREVQAADALAAVQEIMRIDPSAFVDQEKSTEHQHVATRQFTKPKNLVILLEESLGAEFVGSLGGLSLTPELDKLSADGVWFERMYATGVRSVRGIEAVVSGFPPTTARSVVKLSRSQRDFFTIAGLLESKGYDTSFLYGGEPQFDNMARFFANNGFAKIIGRHDFEGEVFDGAWGASDGDLFDLADTYFEKQPKDRPFFSLVFTTSNHSPWDFPEGEIELYEEPAATRNNAVKYADHAVGKFIEKARQSSYWNDTVFVIVADHCSRVYGAELVPIERFRIPALILGEGIEPKRVKRIASQMDLIPTLLSYMGVDAVIPTIGIDQTRDDLGAFPGQATMQYGANQVSLIGDRAVVLQKGKPAAEFRYDYATKVLEPVESDPDFIRAAVARANWPWHVYRNLDYHLEPDEGIAASE